MSTHVIEPTERPTPVADSGLSRTSARFGIAFAAAHELLLEHLAHEEGHALPMLQRTLSAEENAAFEKAIEQAYPLRIVPFALPWAVDDVPADARARLLETTPPGYGLLLRLFRVRYERGERRAFRFA